MKEGRLLNVGDKALTDFNGKGMVVVTITSRHEGTRSQSGICYKVYPPLNGGSKESLYDADWFHPLPECL